MVIIMHGNLDWWDEDMSPKKWYSALFWVDNVFLFFFFQSVKCDISSVGDPRFGDLWPEFEAVYHFKLYGYG